MPLTSLETCDRPLNVHEFQSLAIKHLDTLYRVALRLTRDPASAEDLVQETYFRALRAQKSFRLHGYGIRPWLVRILKNTHLTLIEHERLRPRSAGDRVMEDAPERPASSLQFSSADPKLFESLSQRMFRALKNLPRHYQNVILMWAVDELSYEEIATALSVPIGTVMSRLHRARGRLMEQLGGRPIEIC